MRCPVSLTVSVDEAGAQFTQLLERLMQGEEEVVIARDGMPVARLVSVKPARKPRIPGIDQGKISIAPDFNAPLPDDITDDFYNSRIEP